MAAVHLLDLPLIGCLQLGNAVSVLPLLEDVRLDLSLQPRNIFIGLRLNLPYQFLLHLYLRFLTLHKIRLLMILILQLNQLGLFLIQPLLNLIHLLLGICYGV